MGRLGDAGVAVLLVVALAAVLLAPGLGRAPFDDPGEGQHAEIARELVGGSWLTLRLNGVRYFDKPPLLYWLTAASFSLFGFTEGAARLAPLLGALLAVAATALLGVRLLGLGWGALAGLALLSCALFVAFARYVRPESLFVAAIAWGFTGLLLADTRLVPQALHMRGPRNGPRTPPVADTVPVRSWAAALRLRGAGGRGAGEGSAGAGRAAGGHRDRGGARRAAAARARVAVAARSRAHGRRRLRLVRGGGADRARVPLVHGGGQPRAELSRACGSSPTRTCRCPRSSSSPSTGFGVPAVDPGRVPWALGAGSCARAPGAIRRSCPGCCWRCGRWACWPSSRSRRSSCPTTGCPPFPRWPCSRRARGATSRRGRAG